MTTRNVNKKTVFFSALLVVAVLSLAPREAIPDTGISDKLGHFIAYSALSLLGLFAYPGKFGPRWVVAGLVLYGIGLEVLQILVPSRFFSMGDILANTLGVLLGYVLITLTRRVRV